MSGPIKKGDLVMVVRTCCPATANEVGGKTGVVALIKPYEPNGWRCSYCGARGNDLGVRAFHGDNSNGAPVSWLKKIDPPATGEYDRVPVRKTEPVEVL